MTTNDFVIDCTKVHLAASKNAEYRARVEQRFRVFLGFVQSNGLAKREILRDDEPITENLEIRKSDLTDEGFELVKSAYDKWLRGIDNGKEISDVSVLSKALSKIREGLT